MRATQREGGARVHARSPRPGSVANRTPASARPADARDAAVGEGGAEGIEARRTDGAVVAILMTHLSKRASGADIADREAR
ncbi:hypothetical protein CUJ89_36210 [Burkholderia pyrrocinia]|uniref:Uncharacterized protein n=1 Tax=Burkholderia pyrrocinia TaxID=60550 RepID=A0A2Z5NAT7_BURPY|nr:hypothetical protein CUJ89_36210 [Burkholderia pyrrocinia]